MNPPDTSRDQYRNQCAARVKELLQKADIHTEEQLREQVDAAAQNASVFLNLSEAELIDLRNSCGELVRVALAPVFRILYVC